LGVARIPKQCGEDGAFLGFTNGFSHGFTSRRSETETRAVRREFRRCLEVHCSNRALELATFLEILASKANRPGRRTTHHERSCPLDRNVRSQLASRGTRNRRGKGARSQL